MNIDNAGSNLLCGATMGGTTLTANTWTWVKYATPVVVSSNSAGAFTVTMAGKDDNVEVDRIIMTGDSSCVPDNTAVAIGGVNYYGENCASSDTIAPTVTVTAPANAASVSGATTNITGTTTDTSSITSIAAYLDGSTTAAATDATPTTGAYVIPLSLNGLSVGSHTLVVKATDSVGNVGSSSQVTFTIPDSTAPTVSVVASSSITQTSATVTWTTNEAADSQVEYGTTTAYGSTSTLATTKVTTHSVNVSGLTAGTLYHYRVKSKDAASNLTMSPDATLTTLAPAADTTAPTVSITAPIANAILNGPVTLTATASDAVGVTGVQFQLNGVNLNAEVTSSPFSTSWNTTTTANGIYNLTAIARDAAGNTKPSTSVSVTVTNSTFRAEDINMSGRVDIADFSILSANFNRTTAQLTNPRADIDSSGKVDIADFARLANKFNQ
ncbi:fibronectin type III domain-containing protein [Aeromicrobium sp.]|nr:fibronectin type III domain-containing protein [Candidatus Saccharibacteria bacterium]